MIYSISFLFFNPLSAQTQPIHIVQPGETMYGISKSYQVNVIELQKANPQIVNNAIQQGDTLYIPQLKKNIQQMNNVPAPTNSKPFSGKQSLDEKSDKVKSIISEKEGIQNNQFPMIEHVVLEKETLYSISKKYNVGVEDIQAWNHLADNNIKVGSILLIKSKNKKTEVSTSTNESISKENKIIPIKIENKDLTNQSNQSVPQLPEPVNEIKKTNSNKSVQGQLEDLFLQEKDKQKSLLTSRGTITWINTENAKMVNSYFALHKTAPVGTVVKIINLVNKRVVFVKVIGKLPETSDNINIELRISSAAKKSLLLNGDKAYVDMEYYQ